jgi:hypothetical protein
VYISDYLVGAALGALLISFVWLGMIIAVARTTVGKRKENDRGA